MDMEKRSDILKRILSFSKPHLWYLAAGLVSAVLSVSLTLYTPILIGQGIDQVLAPGKVYFEQLAPILWKLVGVAAAAALFQWLIDRKSTRLNSSHM